MPYEGATHTYTVNGISVGADYEFYMTSDVDGVNLIDGVATGEFFIENNLGIVGANGLASTPIQWNNGAAANIYYVFLEVTGSSGCSNNIRMQITPQVNQFDLYAENSPDPLIDESCPTTDSFDGFDPIAGAYSSGTTTLQFQVLRENGNRAWSFIPQLTVTDALGLTNYVIEVLGEKSGVIEATAGRYVVSELDSSVIVSVSIENAPGFDRNVTLTAFDGKEDSINLSDGDNTNDAAVHTIKVMPFIQEMGGV